MQPEQVHELRLVIFKPQPRCVALSGNTNITAANAVALLLTFRLRDAGQHCYSSSGSLQPLLGVS